MPIFEYSCKDCGHHFEKLQKSGAELNKPTCPECGSWETIKQLSTFSSSARNSTYDTGCNTGGG